MSTKDFLTVLLCLALFLLLLPVYGFFVVIYMERYFNKIMDWMDRRLGK